MSLPPPATFAEGQRYLYGLLAAAAGMFCAACAVAMIALLMWGGWSAAEEHSIVVIFGWSLGGFIAAMTAVMIGLLAGGPVGRFKVAATRSGATIEASSNPAPVRPSHALPPPPEHPGHRRPRRFGLPCPCCS